MSGKYCVFETAIGMGGIAWGDAGVKGVQLPDPDARRARQRLRRRFPGALEQTAPAGWIEDVIERIKALLSGHQADLSTVQLDMKRVSEFERRVYDVTRTIPAGQTLTYGQLANRLGEPRMAREVGQALARNPYPIVVPCHRVLAAGGKLGGFSAVGGVATKQRLLSIERAAVAWQLPLLATN
jgi:methylated-DNA-[protein]-cysteine S-methyltransferase